jgi:hypothetical protein
MRGKRGRGGRGRRGRRGRRRRQAGTPTHESAHRGDSYALYLRVVEGPLFFVCLFFFLGVTAMRSASASVKDFFLSDMRARYSGSIKALSRRY